MASGLPQYTYQEVTDSSIPKGCSLGGYSSKWDKFYAYFNKADTGAAKSDHTKLIRHTSEYQITEGAEQNGVAGSNTCPSGTRQITNLADCQSAATSLHAANPDAVSGDAVKQRGEWDLPGGCHFDYGADTITFNPYAGTQKAGRPLVCEKEPSLSDGKLRTPIEMARWAYITRNYVDPTTGKTQNANSITSW